MNQLVKRLKGYEAPEAELFEVKIECHFMNSTFTVGGSNGSTIDDLGETDTDAGNAIWS